MNKKSLLDLVDNYYHNINYLGIIQDYCIYKEKAENDIQKLLIALLHQPLLIEFLAQEAIENIIKENNIILIHDDSGNYLTSYINQ